MKSAILPGCLSLLLLAGACVSPTEGSGSLASTSCEGAQLDDGGICRKPNGQFAKKVCCTAASFPDSRRSLEAYSCPADGGAVPVAFFDADSTLRVSRSGSPTANGVDDVYVLPFVARHIAALSAEGYLVAIVSNQGGVAAGYTTLETAEGALVFLASQLHELGADVDYIDFADQKDAYRKPDTGMAELLDELLTDRCDAGIDLERSFMIGDAGYKKDVDGPHPDGRPADDFSNSDRGFADNLGIPFTEPADAFGWADFGFHNLHNKWQLLALLEAIDDEIAQLADSGDDDAQLAELQHEVEQIRAINELD